MSEQNAPLLSGQSSDDQSINQSINPQYEQFGHAMHQPINQPINQPMQQPMYAQPMQQAYAQPINQPINQPIYAQPAPYGYNPSINQPTYVQPMMGYPINQPINQPAGYPMYGIAQPINQPINQPLVTMVPIPVGQPGHIQTFGHFSDGLFDCLNSPKICLTSWLLPCYRWPSTVARVGLMSFAMAALLYSALYLGSMALSVVNISVFGAQMADNHRPMGSTIIQMIMSALSLLAVSLGAYHRVKLRERYQIVGSGFGDWCTYFWCSCCAIAQEARHVDRDYGLIL